MKSSLVSICLLFGLGVLEIHNTFAAGPAAIAQEEGKKERGARVSTDEAEVALVAYRNALREVVRKKATTSKFTNLSIELPELPGGLNNYKTLTEWMENYFPTQQVLAFHREYLGFAQYPSIKDTILDRIDVLLSQMIENRREIYERYHSLTHIFELHNKDTSEEKEAALTRFQKEVSKKMDPFIESTEELKEDDFLKIFVPLEGAEIAGLRWELVKILKQQHQLNQKILETEGAQAALEEIEIQKKLLENENLFPRSSLIKLNFFLDSLFFYQQNIPDFLDAKKGVRSLWDQLESRKGEFSTVENGLVLYKFLLKYRKDYDKQYKTEYEKIMKDREKEARADRTEKEGLSPDRVRRPSDSPRKSPTFKRAIDSKLTVNFDRFAEFQKLEGEDRMIEIAKSQAVLSVEIPELLDVSTLEREAENLQTKIMELYEAAKGDWENYQKRN